MKLCVNIVHFIRSNLMNVGFADERMALATPHVGLATPTKFDKRLTQVRVSDKVICYASLIIYIYIYIYIYI